MRLINVKKAFDCTFSLDAPRRRRPRAVEGLAGGCSVFGCVLPSVATELIHIQTI